jgi:serine/threonine-protein kinase
MPDGGGFEAVLMGAHIYQGQGRGAGGRVLVSSRGLTAIALTSPYPAVGDVIDGKYRIVKSLGEGGMGAVAKAEHLLRRVPVALKFMAPHVMNMEGGVERFLNEAVLASQIPNDHVVGIFDVGKLPSGAPYLVMEYLEGQDLADVLDEVDRKGLDAERAVHFVLQILRALQAAHAMGIVHRDLKPANCFVIEKEGEKDFVKLLDFGISKAPVSAGLTHTNTPRASSCTSCSPAAPRTSPRAARRPS